MIKDIGSKTNRAEITSPHRETSVAERTTRSLVKPWESAKRFFAGAIIREGLRTFTPRNLFVPRTPEAELALG